MQNAEPSFVGFAKINVQLDVHSYIYIYIYIYIVITVMCSNDLKGHQVHVKGTREEKRERERERENKDRKQ